MFCGPYEFGMCNVQPRRIFLDTSQYLRICMSAIFIVNLPLRLLEQALGLIIVKPQPPSRVGCARDLVIQDSESTVWRRVEERETTNTLMEPNRAGVFRAVGLYLDLNVEADLPQRLCYKTGYLLCMLRHVGWRP